jgi:hypothetical protein
MVPSFGGGGDHCFLQGSQSSPVCLSCARSVNYRIGTGQWLNDTDGKTDVPGENPVPVSLCPPQISQGLIWDRTRASVVTGLRLTAKAMARPLTGYQCALSRRVMSHLSLHLAEQVRHVQRNGVLQEACMAGDSASRHSREERCGYMIHPHGAESCLVWKSAAARQIPLFRRSLRRNQCLVWSPPPPIRDVISFSQKKKLLKSFFTKICQASWIFSDCRPLLGGAKGFSPVLSIFLDRFWWNSV